MAKNDEVSGFLFQFCFSIFSHPLYFSYFVFFSPYILKLISFLSPLFITTTLLLLALLTISPNFLLLHDKTTVSELSDSKLAFLLSNFHSLLHCLQYKGSDKDEEIGFLEELEAYLVMFQASIFQALDAKAEDNCPLGFEGNPIESNGSIEQLKSLESLFHESEEFEDLVHQKEENEVKSLQDPKLTLTSVVKVKVLESLFQESEEFEDLVHQKGENEAKPVDLEFDKEEEVESTEKMELRSGFKVMMVNNRSLEAKGEMKVLESLLQEKKELVDQKEETNEAKTQENRGKLGLRSGFKVVKMNSKSQRFLEASLGSPENNWVYNETSLGSFGSMRKEKEWRRTLACKLFEERHNNSINNNSNNVNGSEGMDSLWETYETESSNKKVLEKSKTKRGKKSGVLNYDEEDEEEDDDEEEEEDGMDGKLCCLQALKFSAGKMNLGMGRPNLMKISKAFKGMGWLHHLGRHGRKG